MNTTAAAIAAALTFIWLGMVLAISFLEAPLKFHAPGVTIPIGLGIGRLVFRALNSVEAVLAVPDIPRRCLVGMMGERMRTNGGRRDHEQPTGARPGS